MKIAGVSLIAAASPMSTPPSGCAWQEDQQVGEDQQHQQHVDLPNV